MTCVYCRGSLWIVAARRRAGVEGEFHDELGPCPKCQEGRELELTNWPEEGFWHGRIPSDLETFDTRLAPPQVALEHLHHLSGKPLTKDVDA
jgi:hypothetical protein